MKDPVEELFDRAAKKKIGESLAKDLEGLLEKYDATVALFLGAPALVWVAGQQIGTIDMTEGGDPGLQFTFDLNAPGIF